MVPPRFRRRSLIESLRSGLFVPFLAIVVVNLGVFQWRSWLSVDYHGRRPEPTEPALQELAKLVPPGSRLGYVGGDEDPATAWHRTARYYRTQYWLAPSILEPAADRDLVVGSFTEADPRRVPGNLGLIRDFGNGVVLFARSGGP